MDPSLPKKRGRKPKSQLVTPVPPTKPGKLNLSVVEDEDDGSNQKDTKAIHETTSSSTLQQEQEEQTQQILTLDIQVDGTKQILDRFPAFENRPGYFGILSEFAEVYPNKTDVYCWWCCHDFSTHPIGVPLKYDAVNDVFKVIGCFCSFNCAYAHIKKEKLKVQMCDLKFMYEKLSGAEFSSDTWNLTPAPEKYILKRFGGPLTIEEYRSSFDNHFDIMYTPMIPFGMLCDEILGKSMNRGWTKDGIKRPLEIRKAKKESTESQNTTPEKKAPKAKQRTTVNQLISFS